MVLEMDTSRIPSIVTDKYEENVDFQNSCRSFYLHRKKASENFKETLKTHSACKKEKSTKTSLSSAMDRLRTEMVSLVDQDLSLMEQLLTLNEKIEDLKSKRLYGVSKESLENSVENISHGASSVSINSDLHYTDTSSHPPHDSDSGYGE